MNDIKAMLGPYTLHRLIGRGGMSNVFEAEDERLGRRVAIKVVTVPPGLTGPEEEAYLTRIQREVRTIARLEHPNIVTIHDVGEQGRDHFIVMEFLDGITLRQWIDSNGPLVPIEAATILDQVADGMDTIHAAGIVHRDLKASNIMVTGLESGRPRARILDFGVARPANDATVTQAGMLIGTPAYLAPELIQGAKATTAADIWSLGVLLYEMLTGRSPFSGDLLPSVFYKIVHEAPEPTPDLAPAVQDVLRKAMAKNPADRFATGRDLATAFRTALAAPTGQTALSNSEAPTLIVPLPPVPFPTQQQGAAHGRRGRYVTLAAAALLVVALAAWFREAPRLTARPTVKGTSTPSSSASSGKQVTASPAPAAVSKAPVKAGANHRTILHENGGLVVSAPSAHTRPTPHPSPTPALLVKQVAPPPSPPAKQPTPSKKVIPNRTPAPLSTPLVGFILPAPSPRPSVSPPPTASPDVRPTPLSEMAAPDVSTSETGPDDDSSGQAASSPSPEDTRGELQAFLNAWIEANEKKDVDWMMQFYPERLERYYTLLDVPYEHVLRDKERIFAHANRVEMKVSDLDLSVSPDLLSAVLRYRKDYRIVGGPGAREGAVREELHVHRDSLNEDWKIYYERNPRVIWKK